MRVTSALGVAAIVLASVLPQAAQSQSAPELEAMRASLTTPIRTLLEWDETVDFLHRFIWTGYHTAEDTGPDEGGRTFVDYANQYILAPPARQRLDALRGQAQRYVEAGDGKGLERSLEEASPLLLAERFRWHVVLGFWRASLSLRQHRRVLEPWLARAGATQREAAEAHLEEGYTGMMRELERLAQLDARNLHELEHVTPGKHPAFGNLNALRLRLVEEQAGLPHPNPIAPRDRQTPCPPAASEGSGGDEPTLDAGFPSSEAYYPPESKIAAVAGSVVVKVAVSGTGCAQRAEVTGTSGSPELDEGALRLALDGRYKPATVGGKSVPGDLRFRVKFEFTP